MNNKCAECGKEYQRLASHWSRSSCNPPHLTYKQKQMIKGLLMGDGCLQTNNNSSKLEVQCIKKEYLEHIKLELEPFTHDVKLFRTSEQVKEELKKFSGRTTINKANELYRLYTCYSSRLNQFSSIYTSEGKNISNIELSPTALKHWYAGDGYLDKGRNVVISCNNERNREEKLKQMFRDQSFNIGWTSKSKNAFNICFDKETSEKLLNWMGSPPPGYEYKWRLNA